MGTRITRHDQQDSRPEEVTVLTMDPITDSLIRQFLTHLEGRNLSRHTVDRRRHALRGFARHIAPLQITEATAELIEEWLRSKQAPRTRKAYRADLQAFYAWALKRKIITESPMGAVGQIKVPTALPRPLPEQAVRRIIAAAVNPQLRLALMLAAFAGLRRFEIPHLTPGDVDFRNQLLIVRDGKGQKDRTVPLHPELARALERARTRQGAPYVPLNPATVGEMASAHMRSIGYDATIHQLRASFATELSSVSNGNVVLVQTLLGHGSPATTMNYIKLALDDRSTAAVAKMYQAAEPEPAGRRTTRLRRAS